MARDLGIEHIICSRYEVENGEFTGGIERPLCFGEGKVLAAENLSSEFGVDLDQSYFYSDSDDDIWNCCTGLAIPVRSIPITAWPRLPRSKAGRCGVSEAGASPSSVITSGRSPPRFH